MMNHQIYNESDDTRLSVCLQASLILLSNSTRWFILFLAKAK